MRIYWLAGVLAPSLAVFVGVFGLHGQEKDTPISIEGDWRIVYQEWGNVPFTIEHEKVIAENKPRNTWFSFPESYRIEKTGIDLEFADHGGRIRLHPGGIVGAFDSWLLTKDGKKEFESPGIYRMKDGFLFKRSAGFKGKRPERFRTSDNKKDGMLFILRKGVFK